MGGGESRGIQKSNDEGDDEGETEGNGVDNGILLDSIGNDSGTIGEGEGKGIAVCKTRTRASQWDLWGQGQGHR